MKKIFASLFVLLITPILTDAQNIESDFKGINLRYLSADAFKIINNELANGKDKEVLKIQMQKKDFLEKLINDTTLINLYIQTYQEAFEKAKQDIIEGDIISLVPSENALKYGIDEMKSVQFHHGYRSVDSFLVTGIRLSFVNYSKDALNELLKKKHMAFETLAKKCIFYAYHAKMIDQKKDSLTIANIKRITDPIFSKLSTDKRLKGTSLVSDGAVLKLQTAIFRIYPSIKNGLSSIMNDSRLLDKITTEFNDVCAEVGVHLINKFKDLRDGLYSLVKNEEKATDVITELKKDIENQLKQIKNITNKESEGYKTLITEVVVKSDIVSKFTSNGLEVSSLIRNIQSGPISYLIDKEKRDELVKNLGELKVPTLSSALSTAGDLANLLNGVPGANQVGKYLGFAKHALGVGKSIVGLVTSFTPMGFISALSGLGNLAGSLFGVGGPSRTEELINELDKNMMKEFRKVHAQFSELDKKLDVIISKIDTLIVFAKTINENIVKGFEYQGQKLDYIIYLEESNFEKLRLALNKEYNICIKLKNDTSINKFFNFRDYDEIYTGRATEINPCLRTLFAEFSSPESISFFDLYNSKVELPEDIKKLYSNWKDIFSPAYEIFRDQYDSRDTLYAKAYNTLMFPVAETHLSQYLLSEMPQNLELKSLSVKPKLDENIKNVLSWQLIIQFVENYFHNLPRYEFSNQTSNHFKPYSFDEYIKLAAKSPRVLKRRKDKIIADLQYFQKLINTSLAQQSLYSGHLILQRIHSILFKTGAMSKDNFKHVISLLKNNYLLASNFATFLINNSLYGQKSDSLRAFFLENYYQCKRDDSKCSTLDNLIKAENPFLQFRYNAKTKSVELVIVKSAAGLEDDICLPVPDPLVVVNDKMLYTQGVYHLIEMKKMIINKLIDYKFTEYLPEPGKGNRIDSEYYKYLYPLSSN